MPAPDLSRATWRKSSYSNGSGGSCVEIAVLPVADIEYVVAVRDSKDPQGPALAFTASQWRDFTAAIKAHEVDLS
jgi:predicted secreted Zn-dependent protease